MEISKLIELQQELAGKVITEDKLPKRIELVCGIDQAFCKDRIISAAVVCGYEGLEVVERKAVVLRKSFPYIPGLLSFREGPAILRVYKKLRKRPDILIIDGNGILHPRRLGLASHIGVLVDRPTIGVAKRLLCGEVDRKGQIVYHGEVRGLALKTRGTRSLYISPGHKISLESALRIVKGCLRAHKLPEPLRVAHLYANDVKRKLCP